MTSVVIAVYNGEHVLPRTVPAVLEADGVDELVWVDDGSTDETYRVLSDATDDDPRATVVRLESNRGRSAARNAGVSRSRGDVLAFFDADVEPARRSVAGLQAQIADGAAASVTRIRPVLDDPLEPYQDYALNYPRGPGAGLGVGSAIDWRFFVTGACAVRRSDLESVGGFDETVAYGEDQALAARLMVLYPTGLRLAGPPVRLFDIGDLERAVSNAASFGASVGSHPEWRGAWAALERRRRAAPWSRRATPVLRSAVRRLPPGRLRRRAVRYLLGATALSAFDRARDDASSGSGVGRGGV